MKHDSNNSGWRLRKGWMWCIPTHRRTTTQAPKRRKAHRTQFSMPLNVFMGFFYSYLRLHTNWQPLHTQTSSSERDTHSLCLLHLLLASVASANTEPSCLLCSVKFTVFNFVQMQFSIRNAIIWHLIRTPVKTKTKFQNVEFYTDIYWYLKVVWWLAFQSGALSQWSLLYCFSPSPKKCMVLD